MEYTASGDRELILASITVKLVPLVDMTPMRLWNTGLGLR